MTLLRHSTHHLRRPGTVVMLATVSLMILSPVWHQDQHPVVPASTGGEPDIHLCSTGGHPTAPMVCPICVSQRLLAQSTTQSTLQLAKPTAVTGPEVARTVPIAITVSRLTQPRAPPRV